MYPRFEFGDNSFSAYSSPDLQNWTLANPSLLPPRLRPRGTYFRPKVVHNEQVKGTDHEWVLLRNYVNQTAGQAGTGEQQQHRGQGGTQQGQGAAIINVSIAPATARNFESIYFTAVSRRAQGPYMI